MQVVHLSYGWHGRVWPGSRRCISESLGEMHLGDYSRDATRRGQPRCMSARLFPSSILAVLSKMHLGEVLQRASRLGSPLGSPCFRTFLLKNEKIISLKLAAMPDRMTEERERRQIKQLWEEVGQIQSPERFTLPCYINVDTSPEEPSEELPEIVRKRRSMKYVDDRAEVAHTDVESSSIGSKSDEIHHVSISLSNSSSD